MVAMMGGVSVGREVVMVQGGGSVRGVAGEGCY